MPVHFWYFPEEVVYFACSDEDDLFVVPELNRHELAWEMPEVCMGQCFRNDTSRVTAQCVPCITKGEFLSLQNTLLNKD